MELPLLQSKSRVPPHATQLHPRHHKRHPLPNPNSSSSTFSLKNKLIAASLSLFSLLFLVSAALRLSPPKPNANPFGVVLHSTLDRTEVRVFASLDPLAEAAARAGPSLAGEDSARIGEVLTDLVEFAKGRVPRGEWEKTKVQMMGGREMMKGEDTEAFLDICRKVLRDSGFLFEDKWVTVLEDKQEAVYDWVAGNYALGNLGKEPKRTNGIVKLGGTSMQVTFPSLDSELVPVSRIIKLAGVTYNLFTESWPYFGQDAMWKSLGQMYNSKDWQAFSSSGEDAARDPCVPKGYKFMINATDEKVVAGNFSLCTSHVRELLKRRQGKNCLQPPCEIVLSPSIKLQGKSFPFEKVFFISEFFGMIPKASLSDVEVVGHHYCKSDWSKLKSVNENIDDLDLAKYCFSSAYVVALLHDNFGVSMTDKRIGFNIQGKNIPPAWIYGAFILQLLQEPLELERESTDEIVGNDLVTYISLLTVLLIAVLGAVFLLKCQKPQLKTVYDLQKGHYIVTRLPK